MDTVVDLTELPAGLVDRAIKASGKRSAKALVKWALENSAPADMPIKELPAGLRQAEQEFRDGKGKRFKTAAAAMRYLKI